MARLTLYLKLQELKEAELVHARAHYVTHEGRTKADGTVWAASSIPIALVACRCLTMHSKSPIAA